MFGKWFASTYTGSMIGAGANVFAVWSWVVANAGPDGLLEINPALLAAMIGEPVDDIEKAIAYLCAPDAKSRSSAEGGRRIVHVEAFLYSVVNHEKYRAMRDEERRRTQNREAQRRRRQKVTGADSQQASAQSAAVSPRQKTEDRDQKTEEELTSPPKVANRERKPPSPQAIEIAQHLFDSIAVHSPTLYADEAPAAVEKRLLGWCVPIGRALKAGEVTVEDARLCIDYAHHPSDPSASGKFSWHSNLLSGAALRKQWKKKKLLLDARRWRDSTTKAGRSRQPGEGFDFVGAGQAWDRAMGNQ